MFTMFKRPGASGRVRFYLLISGIAIIAIQMLVMSTMEGTRQYINIVNPGWTGFHISFNSSQKSISKIPDAQSNQSDHTTLEAEEESLLCPLLPKELEGRLSIEVNSSSLLEEIEKRNPDVLPGGHWKPRDCVSRSRVLIILPYRNRWEHLLRWLEHYHPILQRQKLDYRIVVVEQTDGAEFNKGRIMNAGYAEAVKMFSFDCVIFHDIDMLLEDDRNIYSCPIQPRHLSPGVDTFKYKLPYWALVGGALAFPKEHFELVNGYTNALWGWGGEDDEMFQRLDISGVTLERPGPGVGRYKMMKHTKRKYTMPYKNIACAIKTVKRRIKTDGLSTVKYDVIKKGDFRLFTIILVDVGKYSKEEDPIFCSTPAPKPTNATVPTQQSKTVTMTTSSSKNTTTVATKDSPRR